MATNRKQNNRGSYVLPLILVIAAGGFGTYFFRLLRQPYDTFRPDSIQTQSLVRAYNGPKVSLPAYLNDPTNLTKIRKGAAVKQPFVKIAPNGTPVETTCEMLGWDKPSRLPGGIHQSENDRQKLLPTFLADCQAKLERLNSRDSYPVRKLIIVDITGGIGVSKPEAIATAFVADEVGLTQLKNSFDAGDSVELIGCKISADRQVDCRQSKADKDNPFKSVEDVGEWLAEKVEDTKETSFYEAFYNIIDWMAVKGITIPQDIKIISDTTENHPETANFYTLAKEGKLKDAKSFPVTFDQVFRRKRPFLIFNGFVDSPDGKTEAKILKGLNVTLVGPPYGTGVVRDRIEQSLAFANYVFAERMHANVVVRYR